MTMTSLTKIQSLTRSRLSCQFSFYADFGSGVRCQCGELDTLGHVRRGCHAYSDILPADPDKFNRVEESEVLYDLILARHDVLAGWGGANAGGEEARTLAQYHPLSHHPLHRAVVLLHLLPHGRGR